MRRKKIIQVPKREDVKNLAATNKCSETAVYNALAFRTDSELAKNIREQAVNIYGGIQTGKLVF